MQENKAGESIELEEEPSSTDIKIVGLYDPEDYGLSMDMWANSDGLHLKALFKNLENWKTKIYNARILPKNHISLREISFF